jgi:DNA-binding MarR family transcriptional regulator
MLIYSSTITNVNLLNLTYPPNYFGKIYYTQLFYVRIRLELIVEVIMSKIQELSYDDVFGNALMVFIQATRLVDKYIDAYFYRKAPITFTKFLFLKILASHNGIMTATQMAEWIHTELHNLTTLVARLKKDELVYTQRNEMDRRKVDIFITDKGRAMMEQSLPVAHELINRIMTSVNKEDAVKLNQILNVLGQNANAGLDEIA